MSFQTSAVRAASALAAFAVLALSCAKTAEPTTPGGDRPGPTPQPEPEPELAAYSVSASEVTTSSAKIQVTMLEADLEYYAGIVTKAEYERLGTDAALIEDRVAYFHEMAELYETDYTEYVKETFAYAEDLEGSIEDLNGDSEYYVYAFTLSPDYLGGKGLVKTLFRTLKAEPVDCSFSFEVSELSSRTATVKVTPSNKECTYFWDCVSAKEYASYGGDEGIIAKNVELIRGAVKIYKMAGYDINFSYFLESGEDSDSFKSLVSGTEYIVFAFGLDPSGTGTTQVYRTSFTTGSVEPSSMTFTGRAYEIKFNGAKILFTPSTDDETYFTDCMDWETFSKFKSDKEITDWVISEAGSSIESFLVSGEHVVDASELLASKTKYVAYAFGYNGGATTGVTTVEFTTPEMPTGSGVTVGIDCQIVDGAKYGAAYAGKKVAEITLAPSAAAEHWYCGTYKSLDGYDDYNAIEAIRMNGYKDHKTLAFPLSGTEVTVAAVAFDYSGKAGVLNRIKVGADGTVTKSATLKSLRLGRKGNLNMIDTISE